MQRLADLSIRRPVLATMLVMTLVVIGTVGYFRLGVDRTPAVDIPTVYISTRLPGASPTEMETLVSQPIEEVVNTIEGITEMRSISGVGNSTVIVQFDLRRKVNEAAEDVRNRLATVLNDLPTEADPPIVSKFDSDRSPVMTIALTGNRSPRELRELADKIAKVQLERSYGVGEVDVYGGLQRAISLWIDPDRLAAYQISIAEVRAAIVQQNANVPGGNVTSLLREQTLRTVGRISDPAEFNNLVITTRNGSPIRIRDVGWAEDGTKEQRTIARLNGTRSVGLAIRRQSDANAVAVIEGVKAKLPQVLAQLPPDVKFEVIEDQSRYIYEALHEIQTHLVLGSALACLVVLLFMRSWRSTLIAMVAIPASVVATFGMMWALNFTLNSVTMLALVLMVGIVIDDAIVVLENIFRFIKEKRMSPFTAAREATREIGPAVLATTLSLVVIFVPVSFMSSIAGRFLFQFGLTAAVAVLVSLLVSFTLTPMMCARLYTMDEVGRHDDEKTGLNAWLDQWYLRTLEYTMSHRKAVIIGAFLVMLSSLPLYHVLKQEYTPSGSDEGEFEVGLTAREGTSLAAMDEVTRLVDKEIRSMPQVRVVLSSTGTSGISGPGTARLYVRLVPHEERIFSLRRLVSLHPWDAFRHNFTQRDVMQDVRSRLRKYPGVRVAVRSTQSSISFGGSNQEIDFSLLGPDLESLSRYIEELRRKAPEMGILDADTTLRLDKPELRVEIDRARAAALGVSPQDLADTLRLMVGGDDKVTRFRDQQMSEDFDVQLRLAEGARNDPEAISRVYVPKQGGGLVRLDNLVKIVQSQTASRIDRLDRQRQVSLRGAVAPGYALADRMQALKEEVKKMNLPAAYSMKVSGRGRELENTFREFLWAFLLSVIFMYMILAAQYESFVHPFTILLSLPLSLPFAFFSLWITGNTLNLYSALGLLVLFGVVKKNAILQIDHMNHLRSQGMDRAQAILQANRDRLRPILMTTLTLVAGMIPLAMGSGPGAEERRAVSVVVIGGQTLCLLLTLLVTPVVYSLLDDLGATVRRRFTLTRPKRAAVQGAVSKA